MTPEELLQFARDNAVEYVDLRYTDFAGKCHHITIPVDQLGLADFEQGWGRGRPALCGNHLLTPVPTTAFLDPFCQHTTLSLLCETMDPATGDACPDDPRGIANRAQTFLESTGVADQALFALAPEFYIFDQVSFEQTTNGAHYHVDSREGIWRQGHDDPDNLGTQIPASQGESGLPPFDSLHNLRAEMAAALAACGVKGVAHRHGAGPGQGVLELPRAGLVAAADQFALCKYVVRNVAARHGKVATFMAQPLFGDAGSALHLRFSLTRANQCVLTGNQPGGLSDVGLWAVGGLLSHALSLMALHCPTTNSYRRKFPERELPYSLAYVCDNPGALVGLYHGETSPATEWIGFRATDGTCNPYLAISALVLAALDGIEQHSDPGSLYDLRDRTLAPSLASLQTPPQLLHQSLDAVLRALQQDHKYLLRGGVLTPALVEHWRIQSLARGELPLRARPHPYEFCLYFDA